MHFLTSIKSVPLKDRMSNIRLKLFHSINNKETAMNASDYLQSAHYQSSCLDREFKVWPYKLRTNLLIHSFFPRTITAWNLLSADLVGHETADLFYEALT